MEYEPPIDRAHCELHATLARIAMIGEILDEAATVPLLQEFATRTTQLAKSYAFQAIEQGAMTRKGMAEIFDVHENTAARWFTERAIEQPPQPDNPTA